MYYLKHDKIELTSFCFSDADNTTVTHCQASYLSRGNNYKRFGITGETTVDTTHQFNDGYLTDVFHVHRV